MAKAILVAAIFGLCWKLSIQQCVAPDESGAGVHSNTPLFQNQREFSIRLLHEINKQNPTDNVFFSPYSTFQALLLAYLISASETEKTLKGALGFKDPTTQVEIGLAYKYFKHAQNRDVGKSYEFNSANRIYVNNDSAIRECLVEGVFKDDIVPSDFKSNPEGQRAMINQWVEEKTKRMIKDLLPPGAVTSETNLVLLNAAYFKGLWASKFNAESTKRELFYYGRNKQTLVEMMKQKGTFNFHASEALKAHILELPYKGRDVSMFILLPAYMVSIDDLLNNLKNPETFLNILNGSLLEEREVEVSLPKFTLETSVELLPVLQGIGLGEVFSENADYSRLAENLTLGNALHKARIEVSEEGTKAAAATVLFTFRSSRPLDPFHFNCNHPFTYFIYSHTDNVILFNGVFRKP